MREFFIDWSERLIAVFVIVAGIGVIFASLAAMFSGIPGGFLQGLLILIGGCIYLIIMGGMLYVAFGIYRNTLETNRLLAEMLRK
ncbi:hypothetical protein [Paracoccus fistulariae]|uniref:Uncharacterized protein n=1 Tax=Paracoccus fistulariae TaxID=658446 RepID=A0ABY7SJJ5_9RHOB|nr:hypothetical protein [Paracoccus fistulariae]MDB6180808.1 hypothetical protein [Paracoccus fistulariae]WCR06971.1 hypothetical protein JHX87_16120 [Paracoccus fistulariae]